MEFEKYLKYCKKLKMNMFELLRNGKSGHIGGSLSCIEILAVIYKEFILKDDNKFVLSKGHCELALYSLFLKENIIEKTQINKLKMFGSKMQGHPSHKWIGMVDYSTGSLGQGLSFATGLATCGKEDGYDVYVLLGDGELQEGQIWEAVIATPRFKLNNLFVIVDCNDLQLEGKTLSTGNADKMAKIWKEFGWNTKVIEDGHDIKELIDCFKNKVDNGCPNVFFAKTIKGHGIPYMENNSNYHGVNLNDEEINKAINNLK